MKISTLFVAKRGNDRLSIKPDDCEGSGELQEGNGRYGEPV